MCHARLLSEMGEACFASPYISVKYYDVHSITEKVDRVQRVLGVKLTPFASGLRETYRWYADRPAQRSADFSFDDKLLREAAGA